jgi:hypothetical protein
MKIHGPLYIFPHAVAILASSGSAAARTRLASIGIAAGLIAVILPFLDPTVSLTHYAAFLGATLQHGFARSLLVLNLRFGGVLVLPILLMAWRRRRGAPQPDLPMGLTYVVTVLIVCLIGAKNGAGPTHLLPFLPAFVYFLVRAAQPVRIPGGADAWVGALSACFLVIALAYAPGFESNLASLKSWDLGNDDPAVRQEAEQLYRDYPAAAMGVGDDVSDRRAEYRAIGVFAGAPLTYDTTTWMDLQKGGVSEQVVANLLTGCRTPVWIIPKAGAPFSMTSPYGPDPMFSDQFRALFQAEYKMIHDGAYYSVWTCRDAPPDRK